MPTLTEKEMNDLWERHMAAEFSTCSVEETMRTMTDQPFVNHVPVLTGGLGTEQVRKFYQERFIPQMPPDTKVTPVSRTIGKDRVVDEIIFSFTHTIAMDWMLPAVAPTGKVVEVPLVVIVEFKDGLIHSEHIYWDQASVLVQLGLLSADRLPIAGVEQTRKMMDPSLPSNGLMGRVSSV